MASCPACHADLGDWQSADRGKAECPFCGVALSAAELTLPGVADAPATPFAMQTEQPPDSRIEVVESGPERLVIHLPPGGGSTSGIGCFAVAWNGFMVVFTGMFLGIGFFAENGGHGPPVFVWGMIALFWIVGIGMAVYWLRMKLQRTYLLLEPDRLVIQNQILGRKTTTEAELDSEARARLVEAYSVNDVPVHAVQVRGVSRTVKFGTRLSEGEKQWLVATINQRLGIATGTAPQFCSHCGARLELRSMASGEEVSCAECGGTTPLLPHRPPPVIPEVEPQDVAVDPQFQVELDSVEVLRWSLPLLPPGGLRTGIVLALVLGGLVALGIAGGMLFDSLQEPADDFFDVVSRIFKSLFLLPASAAWLAAGWLRWGRVRVAVDHDWLRIDWKWGPLGPGRRLATAAIEDVRLSPGVFQDTSTSGISRPRPADDDDSLVATVHAGTNRWPLTTAHELGTALLAAGLMRTRLRRLGYKLESRDATAAEST